MQSWTVRRLPRIRRCNPPSFPPLRLNATRWRQSKRASSAGLNQSGTVEGRPVDFVFTRDTPVTLFEGFN